VTAAAFPDFERLAVGDQGELTRVVTEEDVRAFALLSGDQNPLHTDPAFARRSELGGVVVHGMLGASFISAVIGTMLPGPGALWLSQRLNFMRPVRVRDRLRVAVRVKHKSEAQRVLVLSTEVYNQRDEKVIDGEGTVKVLSEVSRDTAMDHDHAAPGVALVTGASRGIGAAIARRLAAAGHRVVVNFLKEERRAQDVLDGIRSRGGDGVVWRADVSQEDEVRAMVMGVTEALGPIDVLVSNAGGPVTPASFESVSWADVQRQLDVHVRGTFHCAQAVLPRMVERGRGRIIAVGSIYADTVPPAHLTGYVVAKHALVGLCRSLAAEYGPKGVLVNMVAPGLTRTELIDGVPEKARALARMQTPLRRLAEPEDVAEAVAFLADERSLFLTGATLRVCGGQVML
jgi:3-oxoacyl-[acyl-carrier protein] reductase